MRKILCFIIVILAGCKNREASVPVPLKHTTQQEISARIKLGFWNEYKRLILPSDGMKLDASAMLLDADNNKHFLGKLITRPTLIFRYSFKDCNMCIDSAYNALEKVKFYSKKNVVFITDAMSFRNFVINAKASKYNMPVYCIQSEDLKGLGLPAENQNLPFFFVLSADLIASKFFIPYKEMTDETVDYLNLVADFVK